MKPNELRIGNLLKYPAYNKDGSVVVFMVRDIYMEGDNIGLTTGRIQTKVDFDSVTPIPLTDEWLLKFGFELYTENNEISTPVDIAKKHPLWLRLLANEWTIFIKEGGGAFKSIKSVHQLQNLYFALTGEELKIIVP